MAWWKKIKLAKDKPLRSSRGEDKELWKESKTEGELYVAVQDEAVLFVCRGNSSNLVFYTQSTIAVISGRNVQRKNKKVIVGNKTKIE